MPAVHHNVHVRAMQTLSERRHLAVLYYRKAVTRGSIKPRLVEPYALTEGKQDIMVRCFQVEHGGDADDSGWRTFMVHKIDNVEETTIPFRPRRRLQIVTGELEERDPDPCWDPPGRREYRDFVGDAIADGKLDAGELFDLEGIVQKFKLKPEDIRFVHAAVYPRCLGAIVADGFVTDDEVEQIRFLHRAMRSLGWCVGD